MVRARLKGWSVSRPLSTGLSTTPWPTAGNASCMTTLAGPARAAPTPSTYGRTSKSVLLRTAVRSTYSHPLRLNNTYSSTDAATMSSTANGYPSSHRVSGMCWKFMP